MQRKPLLLATLPAVLALGLIGGCSTSDDNQPAPTTEQTPANPSEPAEPSPETSAEPTEQETESDPAPAASDFSAPIAAAHLAMEQVSDSTVTGIDSEDQQDHWEIDLIGPDGKEYDIRISFDGTEILEELDEDSTSSEDRSENVKRLEAIAVDFEQALQIASEQFQNAVLDEIDLDEDNDVLQWDVELDDNQGVSKEFEIDAATGEVSN